MYTIEQSNRHYRVGMLILYINNAIIGSFVFVPPLKCDEKGRRLTDKTMKGGTNLTICEISCAIHLADKSGWKEYQ